MSSQNLNSDPSLSWNQWSRRHNTRSSPTAKRIALPVTDAVCTEGISGEARYCMVLQDFWLRAVRKTRTRGRALPEILALALWRCINAVHETRKHAVMHNSIQFLSICINLSCLKCLKTQYNSMIISSDSCIAALGRFSVLLETWEWDSASSPPQRFTWKKSQSALGKARDGSR